jgi:hypothetical protein
MANTSDRARLGVLYDDWSFGRVFNRNMITRGAKYEDLEVIRG